MSRLDGGIFSKPRGTTAGVVFSSARTRQGKVVTARQFVIPSNPNTVAQQAVRTSFSSVQQILKQLGPECYQTDWNRAVGQLAGYNSLQSVLLLQIDTAQEIIFVNTINLGSLHFPVTVTPSDEGAGVLKITWSTEQGPDGGNNDIIKVIVVDSAQVNRDIPGNILYNVSKIRLDGSLTLPAMTAGTKEIYFYVVGPVGPTLGLCSLAKPYEQVLA